MHSLITTDLARAYTDEISRRANKHVADKESEPRSLRRLRLPLRWPSAFHARRPASTSSRPVPSGS
jgi:hypothetical protein